MKIYISEKGQETFRISLPERIVFNSVSATLFPLFINRYLKKGGIKITGKMCRKFVRGFYKIRKDLGGKIDLVDVESKDGTTVKITV